MKIIDKINAIRAERESHLPRQQKVGAVGGVPPAPTSSTPPLRASPPPSSSSNASASSSLSSSSSASQCSDSAAAPPPSVPSGTSSSALASSSTAYVPQKITPYYSFEFFPPKTEAGLDNLYERIDRMKSLEPLFIDVTWGSGGTTSRETLAIATYAQQYCGVDVLMHLTCTGLTKLQIKGVLQDAKDKGVHNILALRGDAAKGSTKWTPTPDGFKNAAELVKFIKSEYGSYFGIGIAGHPEGHIDGQGVDSDLKYLKEKVDCGGDFIVTQFFYDVDVFTSYVSACRAVGITCPIIPGVMPIQSYSSFVRMTSFCKTKVPQRVYDELAKVRDDDEAVKTKGVDLAAEMCDQLLRDKVCDGVHFYTLNLERSVKRILEKMEVLDDLDNSRRRLPWRPSTLASRSKEEVRPINWANRPKSYMQRTADWDEFPNGRWGDSRSPAFGELSDSHFYRFTLGNAEDRKAMLGECPTSLPDVYQVFSDYVEGKIPLLPWCEVSLQPESFTIQKELAALNRQGFLSINSQPAVNGADSADTVFGWGGKGGYVYQKAYVECFVSVENLERLMEGAEKRESLMVYAVNSKGEQMTCGREPSGVTALTWGVFPNREILQPTVFDPGTFLVWAEEAFMLWETMWMSLYAEDSDSYELISKIHDEFFLVAIVDNEYQSKNSLWNCLLEVGGVVAGGGASAE